MAQYGHICGGQNTSLWGTVIPVEWMLQYVCLCHCTNNEKSEPQVAEMYLDHLRAFLLFLVTQWRLNPFKFPLSVSDGVYLHPQGCINLHRGGTYRRTLTFYQLRAEDSAEPWEKRASGSGSSLINSKYYVCRAESHQMRANGQISWESIFFPPVKLLLRES